MFIWITEGLRSLWIVNWTGHLLSNEHFSWRKCLQNASTRKTRNCANMLTPVLLHCLQNRLQLTSWWKFKIHAQDSLSLPVSSPPVFLVFVFLLFLPLCYSQASRKWKVTRDSLVCKYVPSQYTIWSSL